MDERSLSADVPSTVERLRRNHEDAVEQTYLQAASDVTTELNTSKATSRDGLAFTVGSVSARFLLLEVGVPNKPMVPTAPMAVENSA